MVRDWPDGRQDKADVVPKIVVQIRLRIQNSTTGLVQRACDLFSAPNGERRPIEGRVSRSRNFMKQRFPYGVVDD